MSLPRARIHHSILVGMLAACVLGTGVAAAAEPVPVAPRLSPKLQKLFAEEMTAVQAASQRILAALAAGDHATVAAQAQAIHDSFILDRQLTEQDRRDLETALPRAFLELDADFHALAARLAESARERDRDLQTYFFGRMLEACQACHGRYATDKFPGFLRKPPPAHAH